MTANQKETMALYKKYEASIFNELYEQIRWMEHIVRMRKMHAINTNPVVKDLMIACWATQFIRLNTFFDESNAQNSIQYFICISHQINKISESEKLNQERRLDNLLKNNDFDQFKKVRNRVIAHWQRKRLPTLEISSPEPVIQVVQDIFEACGGRKINRQNVTQEVFFQWKDLLLQINRILKNLPASHS